MAAKRKRRFGSLRKLPSGRWQARYRGTLKPRTRDDYEGIFRNHITPTLGALAVEEITTTTVRRWRADLLDAGMGGNRAAKVYRPLRAVLNTAVDDA